MAARQKLHQARSGLYQSLGQGRGRELGRGEGGALGFTRCWGAATSTGPGPAGALVCPRPRQCVMWLQRTGRHRGG